MQRFDSRGTSATSPATPSDRAPLDEHPSDVGGRCQFEASAIAVESPGLTTLPVSEAESAVVAASLGGVF